MTAAEKEILNILDDVAQKNNIPTDTLRDIYEAEKDAVYLLSDIRGYRKSDLMSTLRGIVEGAT